MLKTLQVVASHYFSSPGLSWGAMLKMTGLRLKKLWTCTYSLKKD